MYAAVCLAPFSLSHPATQTNISSESEPWGETNPTTLTSTALTANCYLKALM